MRPPAPPQPSHAEILARLDQGSAQFAMIEESIKEIREALQSLPAIKADVETMKGDVKATKDLVAAWAAVKTAGRFLKWLGGVVAAIAAIKVGIYGLWK